MSKTEELRAIVQLMVANYLAAEDYASLCDNYRILVHEQKIMKRPPKDFLNGDWLKNEVKNYVLEQYLQWSGYPEFYMLYEDRAEHRIAEAMNELSNYLGYFHRDWWLTWKDRVVLHKRFRKLNPRMARLNDLLKFIVKTPPGNEERTFLQKLPARVLEGNRRGPYKIAETPRNAENLA